MTDAQLHAFREIAQVMEPERDWQWLGPHMSQRVFGISRERAEKYAEKYGGCIEQMKPVILSPVGRKT